VAASVRVIATEQAVGTPLRHTVVEIKGDASYPTGGYAVGTAQGLPAGTVIFAAFEVMSGAAASQTWEAQYDYANNKIKVSRDNGELAAATNLSTLVLRGLIISQ
jgi:hypothetical protein